MRHGHGLSVVAGALVLACAALAQVSAPAQPAPSPTEPGKPDASKGATVIPAPPGARVPLPEGVRAIYDLPYVPGAGSLQQLDLYLPITPPAAPMPLVVWIHTGNWKGGDKNNCPAMGFAARGFAVASVNYRLAPDATYLDIVHDLKASIRFLRASSSQHNIDPARVGVWGASAGGHLAALLACTGADSRFEGTLGNNDKSSAVQACVLWFAPTDLTMIDPAGRLAEDVQMLVGGRLSDKQRELREASPISHVSKDDPPFLIMHGDAADQPAPLAHAQKLDAKLKEAGASGDLVVVPGQGLGFRPKATMDRQIENVYSWFAHQFKVAPPPAKE